MLTSNTKTNIRQYLQQNHPAGILLYGTNFDAVADNARIILKHNEQISTFGGVVINITGQGLKTRSLFDMMHSRNLLGQNMIVYLQDLLPENYEPIREVMSDYRGSNLLLIRTNTLSKTDQLVKFFSDHDNLLAMVHYPDNPGYARTIIDREIQRRNLKISSIQRRQLEQSLQGQSRYFVRSHMKNVTQNIVFMPENTLPQDSNVDLVLHCLSGNIEKISVPNIVIYKQPIPTIRLLIYFLNRIQCIRRLLDENISMPQIGRTLKPPIFPNQHALFHSLAKRWSNDQINTAIRLLYATERVIISDKGGSILFKRVVTSIGMQMLNWQDFLSEDVI